jgi:hypothetical protein
LGKYENSVCHVASGGCKDYEGLSGSLAAVAARTAALELITHTSAAPYGSILLWHGTSATIPHGWVECNGQHGTPDLRDRFVVGAGTRFPQGKDAENGVQQAASCHWVRATHPLQY